MAVELATGTRWRSAVSDAEVIVIRAPAGAVDLRCGGHPVVGLEQERLAPLTAEDPDASTQIGKRYADEDLGLEVLCTKAGQGALSVNGQLLPVKPAKPLPSSD